MIDKENVDNKSPKYNLQEKEKKVPVIGNLEVQNSKISEEVITGDAAIRFHDLLFNAKPDPIRKRIIEDAIKLFPEPEKSKKLEINL